MKINWKKVSINVILKIQNNKMYIFIYFIIIIQKHLTTTINEISSQLLIKEQTIANLHNINTQLNVQIIYFYIIFIQKQLQQLQQQQQQQQSKPRQLEQQQLSTLSPNTTQSSPESNNNNNNISEVVTDGDIQHDEMMNILSLNDELKKSYSQLRDEREKNVKLGEEYMRLKNIYDYEEKEYKVYIIFIYYYKNIILSLRNENTTIKDELEKLQRYYSGLSHSIETSSPIFKKSRDSEMEVLLEKVSSFQKRNEKLRNLLDVKMEENNQLKTELANLHLEHEDLKLKYNTSIDLFSSNQEQQQQINSVEEGEEEEEEEGEGEITSSVIKPNKENEKLMKENEKMKRQIQEFVDEKDQMKNTLSKLVNKINQLSIIKDENDELKTQLRSTTKSNNTQTGKSQSPTIQKIKLNSVTEENEDLKIQHKKDEQYINQLKDV